MALKYECWESGGGGRWYTNDVHQLGTPYSKWYAPMRLMGMSVENYIGFLLDNKATIGSYDVKTGILVYYFDTQKDAKAFCSLVNRKCK